MQKENKKGWTKELVENQDYHFKLFENCKNWKFPWYCQKPDYERVAI